jgi:hypothetical protein
MGSATIEQIVPLVRRALKVLSDREVTPQLGLLKSTLLQLDSTFSERTYGSNSFRDFAQKLAATGVVTLKEAGRNVLVELRESGDQGAAAEPRAQQPHQPQEDERPAAEPRSAAEPREQHAHHRQPHSQPPQQQGQAQGAPRAAEAVEEVRRLFAMAQQPPRWPMYLRQVKQFLRNVDQSFDERKFGFNSLNELLRACQRDGLFRMERDRQGVIRFFQGTAMKDQATSAAARGISQADIEAAERLAAQAEAEMAAAEAREADVVDGDVVRDVEQPSIVDAEPVGGETESAERQSEEQAEPAKTSRRRTKAVKEPKAPKEPRAAKERKTAPKPRAASRRKAPVAAGA